MVSYQTMIKIGFDVAQNKGEIDGLSDGGDLMSGLAQLWNDDKEKIAGMTQKQVRSYLQERITA